MPPPPPTWPISRPQPLQATLAEVLAGRSNSNATARPCPTRALSVDEGTTAIRSMTDSAEPEAPHAITAEEAPLQDFHAKIDRLGPVNMMAVERFDELNTAHLVDHPAQDLNDSITADGAIAASTRTREIRFRDAFEAINRSCQTFSTLFGGGHAGITLIDEHDPLEAASTSHSQPLGRPRRHPIGRRNRTRWRSCWNLQVQARDRSASSTRSKRRSTTPTSAASVRCSWAYRPHAVHPHHAQPEDHGDRRPDL